MFIDQGRKLDYLIYTRGDRRLPDLDDPGVAYAQTVGQGRGATLSPVVVDQATLAAALDVVASSVNRWIREKETIPDPHVRTICRIYAIDDLCFRTLAYEAFVASHTPVRDRYAGEGDWRSLVRGAPCERVRILLRNPYPPAGFPIPRFPRVGPIDPGGMVVVGTEQPFWIEIAGRRKGGKAAWGGWTLLLLSHNCDHGGFMSILPRYRADPAFAPGTFPRQSDLLRLPRQPVLRHPHKDEGEFEMVAIASAKELPSDLAAELSIDEALGPAIEPALRRLTGWLAQSVAEQAAVMMKTRYRVVREADEPP